MDALTLFVAGLMGFGAQAPSLPPSAAAEGSAIGRWQPLITEAAERFAIPAPWIAAVMAAESGGQALVDGQPNTSPAGAIGLMQVLPGTYRELRQRHQLGPDPAQPRDNILAGTAYLRALYDRFGAPGFLAAYNAGPGRYRQFLTQGRPLPAETRRYLAQLGPRIEGPQGPNRPTPGAPDEPPLLRELRRTEPAQAAPEAANTDGSLFTSPRSPVPLPAITEPGGLFVPLTGAVVRPGRTP